MIDYELFLLLCVVLSPYRPLYFFAPLPLKIAPKGGIPATLRTTVLKGLKK